MGGLLSFEEALDLTLRDLSVLPAERVSLAHAIGRVLAEDVASPEPLPRFDYSERDGYALDAAPAIGGPARWRVTAEINAGDPPPTAPLAPQTAARIFTGAALPPGAGAVVMQEDVARAGEWIALSALPRAGAWIRRRGEDLGAGARALTRGDRVGPGALALAAMVGLSELPTVRRPRVAILPNGDELRPAGSPLRPGQIPEANAEALAALARQAGADVQVLPIAPDDLQQVQQAVAAALAGSDLVVTIGGISVGERDHVRQALQGLGLPLDFWRVAIKPGKPLALARRGATRLLGLPGNPASALVTFGLFGMPLLRAWQGDRRARLARQWGRLVHPATLGPEREEFVRVTLEPRRDGLWACALSQQASGAATSLAASDGLARLPRGAQPLPAGAEVEIWRWSEL